MATMGGHTNWSQALSVGVHTARFKKVITCKTTPLSLLLNTALGCSSQQSLVQLATGSTPVSSQNALTRGETAISHAFPFGHLHRRLDTASPTLCNAQEYTSNHSVLSIPPRTSSHIINCPMFRTIGAGGQTFRPCTLRLRHQKARRCLVSERTTPSAPDVNGVMHSYQGTLSFEIPWTTNCSQRVVCQLGSTVSSISSSFSPMSRWYTVCCTGFPLVHLGPSPPDASLPLSPCCLTW